MNNRDRNFTVAKVARRLQQVDASIARYLTALDRADRGNFSGDQVVPCEGTGAIPIVPKTKTSSGIKRGVFTHADFVYDAEQDHCTCRPARSLPRPPAPLIATRTSTFIVT